VVPRGGPLARLAWAAIGARWDPPLRCGVTDPAHPVIAASYEVPGPRPLRQCWGGSDRSGGVEFVVDARGEVRFYDRSWRATASPGAAAFDSVVATLRGREGPGVRCAGPAAPPPGMAEYWHEWRRPPYVVRLYGLEGGWATGHNWQFAIIAHEGLTPCVAAAEPPSRPARPNVASKPTSAPRIAGSRLAGSNKG